MKQFTTVYHVDLGKGYVLSTQYRFRSNLLMCYFPKHKQCDFITESVLRQGTGDITLQKVPKGSRTQEQSLQDAISSLIGTMG